MTNSFKLPRLVPLLMLSACAMTHTAPTSPPIQPQPSTSVPTPTSAISSPATLPLVCSEMQIVQLSIHDTSETKTQTEANNHVLSTLCPNLK